MSSCKAALAPQTLKELCGIVRGNALLLPRGGVTKPTLSKGYGEFTAIDMAQFSGIQEYVPEEFTITVKAGTPIREVAQELAGHGQFLPFDPPFSEDGATIGGTVGAGLSGPGRQRYGGLRDFILEVHIIDGFGEFVRGGGKVVKNSAGFDLPKLMVGSMGRLGILTEVTFKVFPKPETYATLKVSYGSFSEAHGALLKLSTQPFDLAALDLDCDGTLYIRIGGMEDSLSNRLSRLEEFLHCEGEKLRHTSDADYWRDVSHYRWAKGASHFIKLPLTVKRIPELESFLNQTRAQRRYSAGGNVAWIAWKNTDSLDQLVTKLKELRLSGLVLQGPVNYPIIGCLPGGVFLQRVKDALDPNRKFLPFHAA